MSWKVEYRGGIHLPEIDLWLDPVFPVARAFVSHAHFDHLAYAPHGLTLCSAGTSRLMAARLPGERQEKVLAWEEPYVLDDGTELCLYPAGHIFGSAQLWARRQGETLLYTGDFKLRPGRSAEPCATPPADVVIMESTFGLPRYQFPPTGAVLAEILRFCRTALDDGEVPVLFGYSLGKSQELLKSLSEAGLPIMLHPQTVRMTEVYEALGIVFPAYRSFEAATAAGHVLLCPPQTNQSAWLRRLAPLAYRTAMVTGWALDANAVYRYQCDAAFPLSDHADYPDLLEFVKRVGPRRVYTTHGFAHEFARTLRGQGIEAWALGGDNQMELRIAESEPLLVPSETAEAVPAPVGVAAVDSLRALAETAEAIRVAPGKLEKIALLRDYLAPLDEKALAAAVVFFTGRPFPASAGRTLNLGWSLIRRAVVAASGVPETEFREVYGRFRDSGDTTEALLARKTAPEPLPVAALAEWFLALAAEPAPAAKLERLEALLRRLTPLEAKYAVKIITGDLRIGLKEGLVEEALAQALERPLEAVREANMLTGNLAAVARAAVQGKLGELGLVLFNPLQFMLASPEPDAAAILARLGAPVWIEEKYDGIRCQVHKQGGRVEFYSRELKRITPQFPEVARRLASVAADFVADGELLAWSGGRALPFAELQKRLGRRGDDFFLGEEIPVSLLLYDLLWVDGKSLLKEPLRARRAALERLPLGEAAQVAPLFAATTEVEIDAAFLRARQRGNEGLMAKDPASLYTPGRRGLAWLKLKKAYATLDVVVVGVEYGHGKRRDVLSDYTFAIRDEAGRLLPVGKAYTGLTDVEIAAMTDHFLEHTIEVQGRYRTVEPTVVIEVAFNNIQPSARHASGYALRFPRIVRLRRDKRVDEIDTLETCRQLAAASLLPAPETEAA